VLAVTCVFFFPAALKAPGVLGAALTSALPAPSPPLSAPWATTQALSLTLPLPNAPASPRPMEALEESLVGARREALERWGTWGATWERMTGLKGSVVP